MDRGGVYTFGEVDWKPFIKDCVTKIHSIPLMGEGVDVLNISLTKVESGGEFGMHKDPYDHLFYFLIGEGEGRVGDETYRIEPGVVAEIPSGRLHGYRNISGKEMFLITINRKAQGR
jgi:quercetin dioxygenase-like cupin family protein